jgi:hypothetical protein
MICVSWPECRTPEFFRYTTLWTWTHGRLVSVVAIIIGFLLTAIQTRTSVRGVGKVPHSQLLIVLDFVFHTVCPGHVKDPGVGIVLKHFPE